MKPRVLQKGPYMPSLETALAQEFDVHQLWREADQTTFLAQHGGEFVGLATSARWGANAALIDAMPGLTTAQCRAAVLPHTPPAFRTLPVVSRCRS